MSEVTQDFIAHARIVTPATTFVKYQFGLGDRQAVVRRDGVIVAELVDVSAGYVGGSLRVEGTTPEGTTAVWLVDTLGCGCGVASHTEPTSDVPT